MPTLTEHNRVRGLGWLADRPDIRDYTDDHELIEPLLEPTGVPKTSPAALPTSTDLRAFCSPIEDQGHLGSCTANAGVGVLEYFERRAHGHNVDGSRLFLYKVTRELAGFTGDSGAYLRNTMGALALFGVPPESYWPYKIADFDNEPPAFVYALAANFQALRYYRLDPAGRTPDDVLHSVKSHLAAGFPSMFGFTVYASIWNPAHPGEIPFPTANEHVEGGHAIVAVGYDDSRQITNPAPGSAPTTGALLIRNSWGTAWGDAGYGWLPYDYVTKGVAVDWWTMIKAEWIETGKFAV